jgi:hypothetical protein
MHTIAHYAFFIAVTFASLSLVIAAGTGLFACVSLFLSSDAVVVTPRGSFPVEKQDIGINWELPSIFLFGSLLWMVIALGLHAI